MSIVYRVAGAVFLALGCIGLYVPVLPTTPFVLLSAACFAKGSPKFHHALVHSNLYRKNVAPLRDPDGVPMTLKLRILGSVTALIAIAFVLIDQWHVRMVLLLVLLGHWIYFMGFVKTRRS